jgi:hypothetical protein
LPKSYDAMPETSFCIITQPRTGSNHLCGLLNSHPEIVCHYELFNRRRIYSNFRREKRPYPIGEEAALAGALS